MKKTRVSFVIPCLNEQATIGSVLDTIEQVVSLLANCECDIVLADNGSTDLSKEIARQKGARVVDVPQRGYGAALLGGITSSDADVIVFADADNTYNFLETPKLLKSLIENDYDLVLGDRLHGCIEDGAMPFLHRYVGTPVLSMLISLLVGKRYGCVRDCNSGFRVFRRREFMKWKASSTGMEFASEMLIKALRYKARIGWVSITLRKDVRDRVPHLKTWRDGMRHLLQILVASPSFFTTSGAWLFALGILFFGPSLIIEGPTSGAVSIFGIHTLIFSSFIMILGLQLFNIGSIISAADGHENSITRISEEYLFWGALVLLLSSVGTWVYIFIRWSAGYFKDLEEQKLAIFGVTIGLLGISSAITLVSIHIAKRMRVAAA